MKDSATGIVSWLVSAGLVRPSVGRYVCSFANITKYEYEWTMVQKVGGQSSIHDERITPTLTTSMDRRTDIHSYSYSQFGQKQQKKQRTKLKIFN